MELDDCEAEVGTVVVALVVGDVDAAGADVEVLEEVTEGVGAEEWWEVGDQEVWFAGHRVGCPDCR